MSKAAYVYILANKRNGTLYTGVTSDLMRRLYAHQDPDQEGFTNRYQVARLVWFVQGTDITAAIALEKKIKHRSRQWKLNLIEETNPSWDDLAANWNVNGATTSDDAMVEDEQGSPDEVGALDAATARSMTLKNRANAEE